MKIKYLKLKNWMLMSLAGVLGITVSCGDEPDMYGTPEGTYHVSGRVTNPQGDPIEGIGVAGHFGDTTDADGRYDVRIFGFPDSPSPLTFADIDGEQNGRYRDTVVQVMATRSEFHGGDGNWNEGTADITKDVTLQPAE